GFLSSVADDVSTGFSRGMVFLCDRHQPGAAWHFRLPHARSTDVSAADLLDAHSRADARARARVVSHPAPEAGYPIAPTLEAVLVAPRRGRYLEHRAARADHVSTRSLLRCATERDGGAGPVGHAGHVLAVHDASGGSRGWSRLQGRRHPSAADVQWQSRGDAHHWPR